jgi:predicted ABC-type ATPase
MGDPVLHLLAGPNGAGKTTFYEHVLEPATHLEFINADVIAAQRWPDSTVEHAYEAAELAEAERRDHLAEGRSFVAETVFSHPSKVDLVADAKAAGYLVTLHVIVIPEALAVARVANRVTHGGHDVPTDKIRGRYQRLWSHVRDAIAIVDDAFVYDNSRANTPYRLIATYTHGRLTGEPHWPAWTPDALRQA